MNQQARSSRVLETYLSVKQVAERLNFSTRWVQRRIADGSFGNGVIKTPTGDVRMRTSAVIAFLERNTKRGIVRKGDQPA